MSNESAKGHAKNVRNQLSDMQILRRKDETIDPESIEYALEEINAVLEEIE